MTGLTQWCLGQWFWGIIVAGAGLVGVWFGAIVSAPVKQRNEARAKLVAIAKGDDKPKIVVSEPSVYICDARDTARGIFIKDIYGAFVSFQNQSPNISAPNTWAQVSYRDETGKELLSLFPMWEDKGNEDLGLSNTGDIRVIELEPNGIWRSIVVAMKYPNDDTCYAHNHSSYQYLDIRNPNFALEGQKFEVEVILNGRGIDNEKFFFELTNFGKGKPLEIKRTI